MFKKLEFGNPGTIQVDERIQRSSGWKEGRYRHYVRLQARDSSLKLRDYAWQSENGRIFISKRAFIKVCIPKPCEGPTLYNGMSTLFKDLVSESFSQCGT